MRLKALALSTLVFYSPLCAVAASISQLVVFGDSLSDNGNAAFALGGSLPGNYTPKALTDGPTTVPGTSGPLGLWIDQFAAKLGVVDPQPFILGGTNYAVALALTGHHSGFTLLPFPPTAVPYTADQVALYLAGNAVSPGNLYVFWAGSNDINAAVDPITAADNIAANIQTLAGSGAKQFLWLNLPLLGGTPNGKASGQVPALNAASNAFNAEWAIDIAKLQSQGTAVTGVNIGQLFSQIVANPAQYGFTNVIDPAGCGFGGPSPCAANNPNQFLFWDGEHPTTAANAQIATFAFNALVATAVPEPGSLALCFAGFCAVLAARVKMRRR